jgi:hypothetical protein
MNYLHSVLLSLCLLSSAPQDTSAAVPEPVPVPVPKTTCVIDPAGTDSLSPVDRVVLQGALEDLLARAGRSMSAPSMSAPSMSAPSMSAPSMSAPCEEPWSALHTRRAGGVVVSLSALGREVKAFGDGLGSISAIYERLVAALIAGDDVPEPQLPTVVPSTTVPPGAVATQGALSLPFGTRMLPDRQRAPWQIYFNLGLGGAPAVFDDFSGTTSVGYRYMVDHWGFDISGQLLNINPEGSDASEDEVLGILEAGSLVRARAAYVASPSAKSSFFCLAGLGWGGAYGEFPEAVFKGHEGEGFELYSSVGYEISRKESFHYLFELGVTVPMYELQSDVMVSSVEIGPLISLTAGLGWSPSSSWTPVWRSVL